MPKSPRTCDLQSCFLCRTCLEEWRPAIGVYRRNFRFKKGESIFREGDPVRGIYFVYEGFVKVHKKWGQDKELIIRFAAKGDLFGHRGLGDISKELIYPISATAMEPLTVCYIDLAFLRTSLRANFPLIQVLLNFYASELQESERKMRDLAHMPVKGRIAQALLFLRERFGSEPDGHIGLRLSRQDLASFSGTTYETVFRVTREFAREGWISLAGKDIRLLQAERLAELTREDQSSSSPI